MAQAETAVLSPMQESVARLLGPRSIAIVGASSTPGSLGAQVLESLQRFNYAGDIYLINPNRSHIDNRPCIPSVKDLPIGVDCAVLAIPRSGVLEATAACAERGVGGIIIFSSGFAEAGPQGRADQQQIARIARAHGMAIEGPNCVGMINYVGGVPLTFSAAVPMPLNGSPGLALVCQSGAAGTAVRNTLQKREVAVSFSISTGNEAVNGVEDFLDYVIDDGATRAIAMIVEQFRNPKRFLQLVRRAREIGKPVVLLHTGRSAAARIAAQTHTGALTGDYNIMRTLVSAEGVALVETLEELTDVAELLMCCRSLPKGGAAVISDSGALKALALDLSEAVGLELPSLSPETDAALRAVLPEFIPPSNPLDVTAQALVDPGLYSKTMGPLLKDPRYGSLVLGLILSNPTVSRRKVPLVLDAVKEVGTDKPVIMAMLGEEAEIPADLISEMRRAGMPFFRSPERLLRALARMTAFTAPRPERSTSAPPATQMPLPHGVVPEHIAKQMLNAAGIPIPRGVCVSDVAAAVEAADRIGYPVVLKAQSAALSHKSDAGGVVLGLRSAEDVTKGWATLQANIRRAKPGLELDGVLLEAMAAPGLEIILGARNDPDWGPVLVVGLGGIWAEALKDVRLLPPDFAPDAIAAELTKLKGAVMLRGLRGSPAVDVMAIADIASQLGSLVLARPDIQEIDINPVAVYPQGQGAIALDALIVTR